MRRGSDPRALAGARPAAELARELRERAQPLTDPADLDPLIDRLGEARCVLLGEASHGTSEFYAWRARISQRLVREKGFSFIAAEGDWPDCSRVNRYVKGRPGSGRDARDALRAFQRWPTWMWANEEMIPFLEWLRAHNRALPEERRVGFYGLDVYSLWDSLHAIMDYLRAVDPSAIDAALRAARCFEPYGSELQEYGWATMLVPGSCEAAVVELLAELRRRAPRYLAEQDGREAYFDAEQNALVAQNAERYYRTMVRGGPTCWNVRDTHMMDTLDRLLEFHGPEARAIVWAHNTHIGDARATDMAQARMVNLGQLARERHGEAAVALVGFGSYEGSVIAARRWGAPMERMPVPAAEPESFEDAFHRAAPRDQWLLLAKDAAPPSFRAALNETRGHRAIGVVYNPENERFGNYVPTRLADRYDAFLFIDRSEALRPLPLPLQADQDLPETFPAGV